MHSSYPRDARRRRRRTERASVVAHRDLLEEVWAYDEDVQTRTVDTQIVELRRKLETDPENPRYIVTVRKAGYMLKLDATA